MKLARLRIGTQTMLAQVEGDGAYLLLVDSGEPWADPLRVWLGQGQPQKTGEVISLKSAQILAPVRAPSKIIAVGLNYSDHAQEQKRELPKAPMLFAKAPSTIVGPNDFIEFSRTNTEQVDYENELAVVIGQQCRNVSEADALNYVLGYTICNDVTARDAQRSDGQFFRGKSFDTFCPLGPFIVTPDELGDPQALTVVTHVNGEERQNGTTADMIHSAAKTIAYTSTYMTLEPGDVITTGTPSGVGEARTPPLFLKDGDVVRCEIQNLGVLENTVKEI